MEGAGFTKDTLIMCFGSKGEDLYVPLSKITPEHFVFCWDMQNREFKLSRSILIKNENMKISTIQVRNDSFFCSNNQRIAYYNSIADVIDYDYIDNMIQRQIITDHSAIHRDYKDKILLENVYKNTSNEEVYTLENQYGNFFIISEDIALLVEGKLNKGVFNV